MKKKTKKVVKKVVGNKGRKATVVKKKVGGKKTASTKKGRVRTVSKKAGKRKGSTAIPTTGPTALTNLAHLLFSPQQKARDLGKDSASRILEAPNEEHKLLLLHALQGAYQASPGRAKLKLHGRSVICSLAAKTLTTSLSRKASLNAALLDLVAKGTSDPDPEVRLTTLENFQDPNAYSAARCFYTFACGDLYDTHPEVQAHMKVAFEQMNLKFAATLKEAKQLVRAHLDSRHLGIQCALAELAYPLFFKLSNNEFYKLYSNRLTALEGSRELVIHRALLRGFKPGIENDRVYGHYASRKAFRIFLSDLNSEHEDIRQLAYAALKDTYESAKKGNILVRQEIIKAVNAHISPSYSAEHMHILGLGLDGKAGKDIDQLVATTLRKHLKAKKPSQQGKKVLQKHRQRKAGAAIALMKCWSSSNPELISFGEEGFLDALTLDLEASTKGLIKALIPVGDISEYQESQVKADNSAMQAFTKGLSHERATVRNAAWKVAKRIVGTEVFPFSDQDIKANWPFYQIRVACIIHGALKEESESEQEKQNALLSFLSFFGTHEIGDFRFGRNLLLHWLEFNFDHSMFFFQAIEKHRSSKSPLNLEKGLKAALQSKLRSDKRAPQYALAAWLYIALYGSVKNAIVLLDELYEQARSKEEVVQALDNLYTYSTPIERKTLFQTAIDSTKNTVAEIGAYRFIIKRLEAKDLIQAQKTCAQQLVAQSIAHRNKVIQKLAVDYTTTHLDDGILTV